MFTSLAIIRQYIYIMLIGGLIVKSVAYAADQDPFWPQFHGPNRDNLSTEKGLLKEWPEEGPALLWTAKGLGHGYSSVSTAAGMIYTAGNIEEDTVITALGLDGKVLWQVRNGKAWTGDRERTSRFICRPQNPAGGIASPHCRAPGPNPISGRSETSRNSCSCRVQTHRLWLRCRCEDRTSRRGFACRRVSSCRWLRFHPEAGMQIESFDRGPGLPEHAVRLLPGRQ